MAQQERLSYNKKIAVYISIFFSLFTFGVSAQIVTDEDSAHRITLKASDKYDKNPLYRFLWGSHYRNEWNTPLTIKKVGLDTMRGGLVPYQTGGSRQTKSVRVRDKNEREYVFRSVDKTFGGALPDITHGTFIEKLADDQVTISHPFSALAVAPLAQAAGIYHAIPELVYLPKQNALGKFNDSSGNIMYMFEQRPDEDWSTAPNFGNAKKIVSTDKMLEKILEDNDNSVDQKAFVRARLFDMFIGDWGRHEDQWRWAAFKTEKKTLYVPIPRDRDNAFTKFDGFLLQRIIKAAKAKHLQTFDNNLRNVNKFNFPARQLDHHLMNQLSEDDWISIADDLKERLTNQIIDDAIKQFPPEVYLISGPEIAAKLKARREHLTEWAKTYYAFLTVDVEITGTRDNEYFDVNRISDNETEVSIFKINKEGIKKDKPYFNRIFKTNQTNEVRLYGIGGNDEYHLQGKVNKGIKIRLIGGTEKDVYADESFVKGSSRKTKIYDNPGNDLTKKGSDTKIYTSADTAINRYVYSYFEYNKKDIHPIISFNSEDHLHVGLSYASSKHKWRKATFANTQYIDAKYSISQKGFSTTYKSNFLDYIGKWNLRNYANYDEIRWNNFYGLGNETVNTTTNRQFNRIRSEEFLAKINIDRVFQNRHRIFTGIHYSTYRILNDTAGYLRKQNAVTTAAQQGQEVFGGAEAGYVYQHLNDSVLPVKGIGFYIYGNVTDNLRKKLNTVARFGAETNVYVPLSKKFSLMLRGGATTLSGDPEFYQYNKIGGTSTLRGYRRERFYGNSTVFNQNEIRFITNVRSYLFNGKIGVFGLYDAGRVWLKGKNSNQWHTAYGGGIILSPFNRISLAASYAVSPEDANIHFKIIKPF